MKIRFSTLGALLPVPRLGRANEVEAREIPELEALGQSLSVELSRRTGTTEDDPDLPGAAEVQFTQRLVEAIVADIRAGWRIPTAMREPRLARFIDEHWPPESELGTRLIRFENLYRDEI